MDNVAYDHAIFDRPCATNRLMVGTAGADSASKRGRSFHANLAIAQAVLETFCWSKSWILAIEAEEIDSSRGLATEYSKGAYDHTMLARSWLLHSEISLLAPAEIAFINGRSSNCIVAKAQAVLDRFCGMNSPMVRMAWAAIACNRGKSTIPKVAQAQTMLEWFCWLNE